MRKSVFFYFISGKRQETLQLSLLLANPALYSKIVYFKRK